MIPKRVRDIEAADIQALVTGEVPENETLDFKRDLPGSKDESRVEFPKDVTAFANTRGGDLVYGVVEAEGVAKEVVGVEDVDADDIEKRLRGVIHNNVEPHLHAVEFAKVTGFANGRAVLVIRTPSSWARPHAAVLATPSASFFAMAA